MFWQLLLSLMLRTASFAGGTETALASGTPEFPVPTVDSITVETYGERQTPFTVQFGDEQSTYEVMAMFVVPNQLVPVSVVSASGGSGFQMRVTAGAVSPARDGAWNWVAPSSPGLYPMTIVEPVTGQAMKLNVFVMVPYRAMRGGSLNGYRIGAYPAGASQFYRRPSGFIEVSPGMEGVQVSPHFTLGQFLCKQAGGPTRYLVLREPLLVKLETLLAEVNSRGHEAHTFTLMSAYRTPYYNRAIGNITTLSRHGYGDAADIIVDADGDGRMDDLNRDGRHTLADAHWLGAIVNQTQDSEEFEGLTGGMGMYQPTSAHGAFVHVDVRGFPARWGA